MIDWVYIMVVSGIAGFGVLYVIITIHEVRNKDKVRIPSYIELTQKGIDGKMYDVRLYSINGKCTLENTRDVIAAGLAEPDDCIHLSKRCDKHAKENKKKKEKM